MSGTNTGMEIQLSRETYTKIMHWINKSSDEVSGFGKVIYHPETQVFQVVDAYLLKQSNGAAHTDIDAASLAKLMFTSKDVEGELKWWWHSHVNMPVFWSSTDTATIKELASQGWMAATVFNKKEEMRSAVGMLVTTPLGTDIMIKDELPTYIMDYTDEVEVKAWDEEYDTNVQKKTFTPWTPSSNSTYAYGRPSYGRYNIHDATADEEYGSLLSYSDKGRVDKFSDKLQEREDRKYYKSIGWNGCGGKEEAKALGISMAKYLDICIAGTREEKADMELAIEVAIAAGTLQVLTADEVLAL